MLRIDIKRIGSLAAGLLIVVVLGLNALTRADLVSLFQSWCVPIVALLHLVQQAGCGCAWHSLIDRPRPSRWTLFRIRWIRSSIAALVPISGVGAALVAVRLAIRAGLKLDIASASLTLDATMEMVSQVVFTAAGFALLLAIAPEGPIVAWAVATVLLAGLLAAAFVLAQRVGGMKFIDFALSKLARRWPKFSSLGETGLHDQLMRLHRNRGAAITSGLYHFVAWMLGSGEIWFVLFALGRPANLSTCVIVESLSMVGRSAGFFIPGALGAQEIAIVLVGNLVGLPPETAMAVAVTKRLRDIVIGVPGLLVCAWTEAARAIGPRESFAATLQTTSSNEPP